MKQNLTTGTDSINGIYRTTIAKDIVTKYRIENEDLLIMIGNFLCRSFLFYPIQRYDIKGKKYLESDKKYYLSDLSVME